VAAVVAMDAVEAVAKSIRRERMATSGRKQTLANVRFRPITDDRISGKRTLAELHYQATAPNPGESPGSAVSDSGFSQIRLLGMKQHEEID
jgi:hypothetical protein